MRSLESFRYDQRAFRLQDMILLTLHGMDYTRKMRQCEHTYTTGKKRTLISPAGAHADVTDISGLDDVVQGLHLHGENIGQRQRNWIKAVLTVSSIGVS